MSDNNANEPNKLNDSNETNSGNCFRKMIATKGEVVGVIKAYNEYVRHCNVCDFCDQGKIARFLMCKEGDVRVLTSACNHGLTSLKSFLLCGVGAGSAKDEEELALLKTQLLEVMAGDQP